MQLELISPDNGSVVLSHTISLGLLGSLRAAGVDLPALLPKEAIAATWDASLVPLLEGYLNHLDSQRSAYLAQAAPARVEHVVVREVDMTPEQKAELRFLRVTSKTVNDFTTYEYDRVVSNPIAMDTHMEEEKSELLDLIAFFRRGESEHDLLHNDMYTTVPVEQQPVPTSAPGEEETAVHEDVVPAN